MFSLVIHYFKEALGLYSEKAMAPHSSTLAWRIPWTEEPGRLQSMGSLRVGHDWATSLSLFTFTHWRRNWQLTPVFLPGESQGRGSLVGCRLWGRTVRHDWSDLATGLYYFCIPGTEPTKFPLILKIFYWIIFINNPLRILHRFWEEDWFIFLCEVFILI